MSITLTKLSETETTITLGWSPVLGCKGYRFSSEKAAKASWSWDPDRREVRFQKGSAWYRVEALNVLEAGVYPEPVTPPAAEGLLYPASAHIWGGNSAQAMLTHDIVIASDASQGNPKQARATNPRLRAFTHPALDPFHSDWRWRRGTALTYGSGLAGGRVGTVAQGYVDVPRWAGATDGLQPSPQGLLRAYTPSLDDGDVQELDDIRGFALHKLDTAHYLKRVAWYAWKIGKCAENGWDGIWSDNFWPGDSLRSGNIYGSDCTISSDAWNAGYMALAQGLRDLGVPFVGGNVAWDTQRNDVRASVNLGMFESLEMTISQGPGPYPNSRAGFATLLSYVTAWQKAGPQPRYFVFMHKVAQSDTAGMRFGLALACIAGVAYIPYQSHSDLYLPAEMKKEGQRHYLGAPVGDWTRSGNTWARRFANGLDVTANWDTRTASFG